MKVKKIGIFFVIVLLAMVVVSIILYSNKKTKNTENTYKTTAEKTKNQENEANIKKSNADEINNAEWQNKSGNISNDENRVRQNNTDAGKYYSNKELVELAMNHYERHSPNGFRPPNAGVKHNNDGTVTIHLYESFPDHNATCDWYTVDEKTLQGTNFMKEPINLNE